MDALGRQESSCGVQLLALMAGPCAGVPVPLRTGPEAGRLDLDAMADAVTACTRVMLVCSPNNPTDPAVTRAELDAFLARVPRDVLVVLDEAYIEFVRDPKVPDSQANFVWLALGDRTTAFAAAARSAGVILRPFAGEGVRGSVREPEATDPLLDVVGEWGPPRN